MADVAYNIKIKNLNKDGYTTYDIGALDKNIKTNTNNDTENKFLINTGEQILSNTLSFKFNKETISSNKDFNTINRTGYYDITFNITANKPPFSDNTTIGSSLLVLNNIQIAFKGSEVYTRSGFSGSWTKGLGTDFTEATNSIAGTRGLVPAPANSTYNKAYFLGANGKWNQLEDIYARLGTSETFTAAPTFQTGFKSEGAVSITAEDTSDNKALSVDHGIKAGNIEITSGDVIISNTTSGNISVTKGYIKITNGDIYTSKGNIYTSDGFIKAKDDITSTNGSISASNGNITAKTLNITSTTNVNIEKSFADDTTCAARISGGLHTAGKIKSDDGVYNAVWNDLADSIPVNDEAELEPGYCYCIKNGKYLKSSKYMDTGIIGIHSDTYGFQMGGKPDCKQLDCAVSGFVLAYVDKEYLPGTALTCTKDGRLTKMKFKDKQKYPERIVATYWKDEPNEEWGSDTRKVKVNGRKWVKIK